jgi:hypothetical protein
MTRRRLGKKNVDQSINRKFFAPFPSPDWSLLVNRWKLVRAVFYGKRKPFQFAKNWPPSGWESDMCTLNGSTQALDQWFTYLEYLHAQHVVPADSDTWCKLLRDTQRWLERLRASGSATLAGERRLAVLSASATAGVAGRPAEYKEAFEKVKKLRPRTPWQKVYAACRQAKLDVPDEFTTFVRTMQTKLKRQRERNTK